MPSIVGPFIGNELVELDDELLLDELSLLLDEEVDGSLLV